MKDFTRTRTLSRMEHHVKLAYTLFILLSFSGITFTAIWSWQKESLTPSQMATHFRGSEAQESMKFPKTLGELLETSHFHAFTMPVIFLIFAHLFYLTSLSSFLKHFFTLLLFFAILFQLLAPYLILYVHPLFSWLYFGGSLALYFSLFVMSVTTLLEMWRR